MKRLALSLCLIAVSTTYVWQQAQWAHDPSQVDADLLGDPISRPALPGSLLPIEPSAALFHPQQPASPQMLTPVGILRVASVSSVGSAYADGEFTGPAVNAYYGMVQILAVVQGGRVSRLKVLQYPSDRQTSIMINKQALPLLRDEVIAAQSANVDIVSGATLTSQAFIKSLGGALKQAR